MRFGFHVSIAGGFARVRARAEEVGCECIQVFSSNPRGWAVAALDSADVARFRADIKDSAISPVFCHAPYLPNLAAGPGAARRRSVGAIAIQLERCAALGIDYLIAHVGRAVASDPESRQGCRSCREPVDRPESRQGCRSYREPEDRSRWREERALCNVAGNVNAALAVTDNRVMILLENTAGMGSEVGWSFAQIAGVIANVAERDRVGVMLDTAHAFAAGYEWRTKAGIDATMREFDRTIGIARLHGLHLNDSKSAFGSRVDRHEDIGRGRIGRAGMGLIVNHPLLRHLPAVMETHRLSARDDVRNMRAARRLVQ